jgi:hypothetical protein
MRHVLCLTLFTLFPTAICAGPPAEVPARVPARSSAEDPTAGSSAHARPAAARRPAPATTSDPTAGELEKRIAALEQRAFLTDKKLEEMSTKLDVILNAVQGHAPKPATVFDTPWSAPRTVAVGVNPFGQPVPFMPPPANPQGFPYGMAAPWYYTPPPAQLFALQPSYQTSPGFSAELYARANLNTSSCYGGSCGRASVFGRSRFRFLNLFRGR